MPFDFKKEYRGLYQPKDKPSIVEVPAMWFLAVEGTGDPNEEGGAYKHAIELLYGVAYTLKMSYTTDHAIEGFFEYVVPPLEGFWWQEGVEASTARASPRSAGCPRYGCPSSWARGTSPGPSMPRPQRRGSTSPR